MEEKDDLSLTITMEHKISKQMIDDLMVCAFEGGINYWCGKVRIIEFPPDMLDNNTMLASTVLANNGIIKLFDAESNDTWILNRMMVMKGISMFCKENNVTPDDMYENSDANIADSIIQYALFDELVFG